jgi:RNA polymerase sigma-70 factor (ECF subfamily)
LSSLDAAKREVFVLAELEQMTGPEIAEVLGLSVNTVYSRLREARIRFERQLAFRDAATRKVP